VSGSEQARTDFLTKTGWTVLRFWNMDVDPTFEAVLTRIAEAAGKPFG